MEISIIGNKKSKLQTENTLFFVCNKNIIKNNSNANQTKYDF